VHGGMQRVIGVGNGALGQANNLPQCGLTCPNAANVPQCDSRRPGGRGARDGVCFHSDASGFTAVPHFASVITLAKWRHPFENSASLAKQPTASTRRARLPFESTTSLAKRPRSCPDRRTSQYKTPPRRDGRPYGRGFCASQLPVPAGGDGMAALIVGDPRSRLAGVVRGSPIVGRLCPGSSPGSQRGAVGLRTDLGRERARTENGPGPRTGSDCERTRTTSGPGPGAFPGLPRPRWGAPQCPYAWRSRSAGFGRRLRCPFHTRLTTWAATSSFFMRLSSNHHCPTWAMSPTSICA